MRINRAVGFLIFLLVGQFVFGEILRAFSEAIVAVLNTVTVASESATVLLAR